MSIRRGDLRGWGYGIQTIMANTTDQLTAEELASMPDNGNRCELVDGVLQTMSPAGGRHGRIAGKLFLRVGDHVERKKLGATFAAETGFLLHRNPDTVRAPDLSFVSHERLGDLADYPGFLPLAPDLVAEVVSPHDESSHVEAKATAWLEAGVRVVLVVDPQTRSVREYRSPDQIRVYRDGAIDLGDVLPDFRLDVAELFG
ncbi:MAG: Uma2 family endonuclease [Pirellulaceae bacterium]